MAKDALTGIRIGNTTYQEGRQYRGVQVPQFLLHGPASRGASRVIFDVTGHQLTITVANQRGTLVGQFAVRGRALPDSPGAGIAQDFAVKRVVEASQTLGSASCTLRRGVATSRQRFSFNDAYRRYRRDPGPLSRDIWESLALSTQSSSAAITSSRRELKPELGAFASAFAGEWWAPVV